MPQGSGRALKRKVARHKIEQPSRPPSPGRGWGRSERVEPRVTFVRSPCASCGRPERWQPRAGRSSRYSHPAPESNRFPACDTFVPGQVRR